MLVLLGPDNTLRDPVGLLIVPETSFPDQRAHLLVRHSSQVSEVVDVLLSDLMTVVRQLVCLVNVPNLISLPLDDRV